MKMLYLVTFTIVLSTFFAHGMVHWGYEEGEDELDPINWFRSYNSCAGHRQSPIDIERDDVVYDSKLRPLVFDGYNITVPLTRIINNGHSVVVPMPNDVEKFITMPTLNITYKLVQLHFHWSQHDNEGSEHSVLGSYFPLEMHMVHVEHDVTIEQALSEPFGILALSVLFKIGKEHKEMSKITNQLHDIEDPVLKDETTVQNLNLRHILPPNILNYLHYPGSLTTPPCNEVVQWCILTHVDEISHEQLHKFRSLKHEVVHNGSKTEEEIKTNARNLQNVEDRKVGLFFCFDDLDSSNSFVDFHEIFNSCEQVSFTFVFYFITLIIILLFP